MVCSRAKRRGGPASLEHGAVDARKKSVDYLGKQFLESSHEILLGVAQTFTAIDSTWFRFRCAL
jgi:hypothetical protein